MTVLVAKFDHAAAEPALLSPSRIDGYDLAASPSMTIDEAGQQLCMSRLVDEVAANDQVEPTKIIAPVFPVTK